MCTENTEMHANDHIYVIIVVVKGRQHSLELTCRHDLMRCAMPV